MKNENINSADFAWLRQKAEEKLKKKHAFKVAHLTKADTVKLVHELEIHQIELEMQNEELRLLRDKAKTAAEKYNALYDFAYTGYFTVGTNGNIFWLNLSGAMMLGRDRSNLVNRYFKNFITLDTLVDITKRKRAEEILKHKAHELEQFNDLMEVSDVQMSELKKEINFLLIKLGEKEKFLIAG